VDAGGADADAGWAGGESAARSCRNAGGAGHISTVSSIALTSTATPPTIGQSQARSADTSAGAVAPVMTPGTPRGR
jgi:hypothetical protein